MTKSRIEKLRKESKSGLSLRRLQLAILQLFDSGAIEKLYDVVSSYLVTPPDERMKRYSSSGLHEETLQAIYEEECVYGGQLEEMASELAIVTLYKKVEIDTKLAIEITFPGQSTRDLFRTDALKKFLGVKGIDITKLPRHGEVDEILLINNCIKHSDLVVSKDLAAISSWAEGTRLTELQKHFHRLAETSEFYMKALIGEFLKLLKYFAV